MAMRFMAVERVKTKTSKALALLKDGETRKALAIFRTFRIGFTRDEKRTIQIASDTLNGSGRFYSGLGIDASLEVKKAIQIVRQKYDSGKG